MDIFTKENIHNVKNNHRWLKEVLSVLYFLLFYILFNFLNSYVVLVFSPPKKSGITSSGIIYLSLYLS